MWAREGIDWQRPCGGRHSDAFGAGLSARLAAAVAGPRGPHHGTLRSRPPGGGLAAAAPSRPRRHGPVSERPLLSFALSVLCCAVLTAPPARGKRLLRICSIPHLTTSYRFLRGPATLHAIFLPPLLSLSVVSLQFLFVQQAPFLCVLIRLQWHEVTVATQISSLNDWWCCNFSKDIAVRVFHWMCYVTWRQK